MRTTGPECPTCGRLTYSLSEYAKALGISERQARYQLAHGELDGGVIRVGDRVLVMRQFVRDQIDRALGVDPYPEIRADEAEFARESEATERETAKADEAGAKRYMAMAKARGDVGEGGAPAEVIYR